ncbi:MAG: hypothetical protein ACYSR0_11310 [Planctomycetota bacterium]|jgi:hypothetical protein
MRTRAIAVPILAINTLIRNCDDDAPSGGFTPAIIENRLYTKNGTTKIITNTTTTHNITFTIYNLPGMNRPHCTGGNYGIQFSFWLIGS